MRRKLLRLVRALETLSIVLVDVVSFYAVFKAAAAIRVHVMPYFHADYLQPLPFRSLTDIWWVFLIWFFFYAYEGLYTQRFSFWDEVKTIWKAVFLASVGVFTVTSLGHLTAEVSRTVTVLMGGIGLLTLPVLRILAKKLLRGAGLLKRRVLILGAGKTGALVAKALKKEPNLGYDVIGFLDDDERKVGTRVEGVRVHRGVDSALTYLRRCNVSDLVLAMPGAGRERLQGLIREYQHQVPNMLFVPDLMGMAVLGTSLKHFFDEQAFALEVKNELARPLNRALKRAFDLAVGSALLILLAVPLAAIGLLIRLTSAGPALYLQERVGKGGRSFRCLKFRTMYADADRRLAEILSEDPAARAEWDSSFKLRNDPRVTVVGAFLRKTSLDELPQLLNVLAGAMSLVGPRPVTRSEIDDYYREEARLYLSVLPGITGLWQVSGRSNTDYDYRIALDSWYVRNWNLWLDVVILMKTVGVVARREGAY